MTGETGFPAGLTSLEWPPTALYELGDVLDVGILSFDVDLVVHGWNRWFEVASKIPSKDAEGRSLLELFPEIGGRAALGAFRRAVAGETVILAQKFHRYLLPLSPPPGLDAYEHMQQSVRILPIVQEGVVRGAIAIIQDVTERVAREEELRRATEVAQHANRAKSDFLATMSHELRTPLNAVLGYTDLLATGVAGEINSVQREQLSRIQSSSWHLISIIDEILLFARMEAGKEVINTEMLDAAFLARDTATLLQPQATKKGLTFTLDIPDRVIPLVTDARKLRQILLNLLSNALKFTDEGSVTLEVREEPTRVAFTVHDSGPGISIGNLSHIFEPFMQVDQGRTRKKGGTGLGLPVSRNLAQLLGGELKAESREGKGSTFSFWIPKTTLIEAPVESIETPTD